MEVIGTISIILFALAFIFWGVKHTEDSVEKMLADQKRKKELAVS